MPYPHIEQTQVSPSIIWESTRTDTTVIILYATPGVLLFHSGLYMGGSSSRTGPASSA